MTDRFALVYRLRPGARETYVKAHREIWPEMEGFLRRAGLEQMTIFLRGDTLFLYAEVDNIERYAEMERTDPVSRRWEAWMATLLDQPYDEQEPGIFAELEETWHFPVL
jgi:L-rhamnose mutarotase